MSRSVAMKRKAYSSPPPRTNEIGWPFQKCPVYYSLYFGHSRYGSIENTGWFGKNAFAKAQREQGTPKAKGSRDGTVGVEGYNAAYNGYSLQFTVSAGAYEGGEGSSRSHLAVPRCPLPQPLRGPSPPPHPRKECTSSGLPSPPTETKHPPRSLSFF